MPNVQFRITDEESTHFEALRVHHPYLTPKLFFLMCLSSGMCPSITPPKVIASATPKGKPAQSEKPKPADLGDPPEYRDNPDAWRLHLRRLLEQQTMRELQKSAENADPDIGKSTIESVDEYKERLINVIIPFAESLQ